MNLKNKIILVTGAGSGIGRELTLILVERGAKVAAADINEKTLDETKEMAGQNTKNISTHVVNIADKLAVNNLPQKVIERHGNIDVIINNAGIIQPFVKLVDIDEKAIERVMNINFYGTLYITKAFLPLLLKRPEAYIVNISSMGGFLPVPGQSVYGASKAAVKLLTEGLYAELRNSNVHVSTVFPGATSTNIATNSGIERKTMSDSKKTNIPTMPAKTTAEIIVSAMEKNKPLIFTGKDSKMMNFLYRLNPVYATNLIAKKMSSLLK